MTLTDTTRQHVRRVMDGIPQDTPRPHFFSSFDVNEWRVQLQSAWGASPWRVTLFWDDVPKYLLDGRGVLETIRESLQQMGAEVECVSAPTLAKVRPQEFHASVEAGQALRGYLAERGLPSTLLVLGSGALTDTVKWAAEAHLECPLWVMPTALTVTAYSSSFAVLEQHGVKKTRPSRTPDGVFWCAEIFEGAPTRFTRAGYGDTLAVWLASADWKLASELGLSTSWKAEPFTRMDAFRSEFLGLAPRVRDGFRGDRSGGLLCAELLGLSGILMNEGGETTPLSGFEHACSHALDLLRLSSQRPLSLHGEQVALFGCAASACWDAVLSWDALPEVQNWRTPRAATLQRAVSQMLDTAPWWGDWEATFQKEEREKRLAAMGPSLEALRAALLDEAAILAQTWEAMASERGERLRQGWHDIRAAVRPLALSHTQWLQAVEAAGLASCPEELSPAATSFEQRWAVRFSPFVRVRFSLGDFVFLMGEDPCFVAAI